MTKIISAYSTMGKTGLAKQHPDTTLDLDSSPFSWLKGTETTSEGKEIEVKKRNPQFLTDYFNAIVEAYKSGKYKYILISTHRNIREKLKEEGYFFYSVFPTLDSWHIVEERMTKRGDSESFIDMMKEDYEEAISDIKETSNGALIPVKLVARDGSDNGFFLGGDSKKAVFNTLEETAKAVYEFTTDISQKEENVIHNIFEGELTTWTADEIGYERLERPIQNEITERGRWHIHGEKVYAHPTDSKRFLKEYYTSPATENQEREESWYGEVEKKVQMVEVVTYV